MKPLEAVRRLMFGERRVKVRTLKEYSNLTRKGKETACSILFSFNVCSICFNFTTWGKITKRAFLLGTWNTYITDAGQVWWPLSRDRKGTQSVTTRSEKIKQEWETVNSEHLKKLHCAICSKSTITKADLWGQTNPQTLASVFEAQNLWGF